MSPVQIIPDPTFPGRPSLDRAQTAGLEQRFGQMDLNHGWGPHQQTSTPAYSMSPQPQYAAAAQPPGASQHPGYAQHPGVSLESPLYQSYILEKVILKGHKPVWTLADRRRHPMTPEKMKERITEYDEALKVKKKPTARGSGWTMMTLDSPDMNPKWLAQINQLAQDLAYHEHGPSYVWNAVYLKLKPESAKTPKLYQSFVVIMRGDRHQRRIFMPSGLKYPLEARIDLSETKVKNAQERTFHGLPAEYEYPWLKQQARAVHSERNAHPQSWSAPERPPTQPQWPTPNRDQGQPGWSNQGRAQQQPDMATQDRGQQQSGWPTQERGQHQPDRATHERAQQHSGWPTQERGQQQTDRATQQRGHQQSEWMSRDHGHQQSTWKAQDSVPVQPSQPKAQAYKPTPIVQLSDSRTSSAEGGHPNTKGHKSPPIVQISGSSTPSTERSHPKNQGHKPTPIVGLGNSRLLSDRHQDQSNQAPASPSSSDSSYRSGLSRSTARTDQTRDTVYTASDTGATTSGSHRASKTDRPSPSSHHRDTVYVVSDTGAPTSGSRASKADRRSSSDHYQSTGLPKESSHKHRHDTNDREPDRRQHDRRDPTDWGMSPEVEADRKKHRESSYSRREYYVDEVPIAPPAPSRDDRRRSSRHKSHGGHREHTRYYDSGKSSSHDHSAERPRRSSRRERSPSASSSSSESLGSDHDFEDVSEDDDADSMDSRGPSPTRGPRPRITPRLPDRRDSTHARRERDVRSKRALPIITESRSKRRHERRNEREAEW